MTTEEHNPSREQKAEHGNGCGCGAWAESASAMAGCRGMFEHFMSGAAPAAADEPPAATVEPGPCKQEARR